MKPYAGIGSRETPREILEIMTNMAKALGDLGFTLRSGGADGADLAFELGATSKEIYLPWRGFNGNKSPLYEVCAEAEAFAKRYTPYWNNCSIGAKKLKARNIYQLLGKDLKSPSLFGVCWTPGGVAVGGTGLNINIAKEIGIKIFNLFSCDSKEVIEYASSL